jgi:CRP-like cAMP-binding protein
MSDMPHTPTGNRILDALPGEDYERLSPYLEPAEKCSNGFIFYDVGERMKHVYFLTRGMISLVAETSHGTSIEVGLVGREGMAGISAVLGVNHTPHRTMVQIPGAALQLEIDALRSEFGRGGVLHDLLLRYMHTMLLQISQTAVCNRLHRGEERLARWLLMSSDRSRSHALPLTQEFLALMLGTRRAGVTEAAIKLQGEGLIKYTRGNIQIKDRDGLEETACDCYKVIKAEFDRLAQ